MPFHSLTTRVQRKSDIISAQINDETVMMSAELGEYYSLNAVASDIWQRLAQPIMVGDLIRDLLDSYQGDPEAVAADVQELLTRFAAKDLLLIED